MDAASCFILGSAFIPAAAAEPTRAEFRRLLRDAKRHKQKLPRTLFVPREDVADRVTLEASQQSIEVVRIPESELLIFHPAKYYGPSYTGMRVRPQEALHD
jgi:hypothetical protein